MKAIPFSRDSIGLRRGSSLFTASDDLLTVTLLHQRAGRMSDVVLGRSSLERIPAPICLDRPVCCKSIYATCRDHLGSISHISDWVTSHVVRPIAAPASFGFLLNAKFFSANLRSIQSWRQNSSAACIFLNGINFLHKCCTALATYKHSLYRIQRNAMLFEPFSYLPGVSSVLLSDILRPAFECLFCTTHLVCLSFPTLTL